ncbi:hypothetical protein U2181_15315, partial [Listeria monocytogenes]|uniref:hypothetical protein n=1 Tax=Listeria monocytogenes TaxID=1639 RepID=UPI002FDC4D8C
LLILDEGHAAPDMLSDYLSTRVYETEIRKYAEVGGLGDDIAVWKRLAVKIKPEIEDEVRTLGMELAHLGRKGDKDKTKRALESLHTAEK